MTTPLMPLKQVHIVRRANPDTPDDAPPLPGDTIHVELDSGYVHAVDPVTRLATVRRQEFEIVSPLGNFLVKDVPPAPAPLAMWPTPRIPDAVDREVGISIRFIRSYDAMADRWPTPIDVEMIQAARRRPLRWWTRLGCWLYWTFYDRWRDRDACE